MSTFTHYQAPADDDNVFAAAPQLYNGSAASPKTLDEAALLAIPAINLNHIIFGTNGHLLVYEPDTPKTVIDRALRFAKRHPSPLDYTSNEDIFYDHRFGTVALQGTATWDGTPTIGADGVVAGNGPTLASVEAIDWSAGGTLTATFKMGVASDDASLSTPQQLFGPIYAATGALQAKDGTNTASVATTWASGDVVTVEVEIMNDGVRDLMRIVEVE